MTDNKRSSNPPSLSGTTRRRHVVLAEIANDYLKNNPDRVMSDVTFGELSLWLIEQATIEEKQSRELVVKADEMLKAAQHDALWHD